jgi:hypothetical protein
MSFLIFLPIFASILKTSICVNCPIGFEEFQDYCFRIKSEESFYDKYERCNGNEVPLNLYELCFVNWNDSGWLWTDYTRAYDMGPFINWRLGDESMGEPLYIKDWATRFETQHGCLLVDPYTSKRYKSNDCNAKASRLCMFKANYDIDQPSSEVCLDSPEYSCLWLYQNTESVRGKSNQDDYQEICRLHGYHLLNRGFIYTNHPFYSEEVDMELMLGIKTIQREYYWEDSGEKVFKYIGFSQI